MKLVEYWSREKVGQLCGKPRYAEYRRMRVELEPGDEGYGEPPKRRRRVSGHPGWIGIDDAAKLLNVGRDQIFKWIEDGWLTRRRQNIRAKYPPRDRWLISRASVVRLGRKHYIEEKT
jgi:hypothetical protein